MSETISFFIPGLPRPGGSKRAFFNKKTGKALVVDACKDNHQWRLDVASVAMAYQPSELWVGPVEANFYFFMPRPKSHYRTGKHAGELKPNAPMVCATKPDRTKLVRAAEDALTGIIWRDDAQVVVGKEAKLYTCAQHRTPGLHVSLRQLSRDEEAVLWSDITKKLVLETESGHAE